MNEMEGSRDMKTGDEMVERIAVVRGLPLALWLIWV